MHLHPSTLSYVKRSQPDKRDSLFWLGSLYIRICIFDGRSFPYMDTMKMNRTGLAFQTRIWPLLSFEDLLSPRGFSKSVPFSFLVFFRLLLWFSYIHVVFGMRLIWFSSLASWTGVERMLWCDRISRLRHIFGDFLFTRDDERKIWLCDDVTVRPDKNSVDQLWNSVTEGIKWNVDRDTWSALPETGRASNIKPGLSGLLHPPSVSLVRLLCNSIKGDSSWMTRDIWYEFYIPLFLLSLALSLSPSLFLCVVLCGHSTLRFVFFFFALGLNSVLFDLKWENIWFRISYLHPASCWLRLTQAGGDVRNVAAFFGTR